MLAFSALLHTICAETVKSNLAGAAIGSSLFSTGLGGMIGPIIFGLIVDYGGGYKAAWAATGTLVMAGAMLVAFGFKENLSTTEN